MKTMAQKYRDDMRFFARMWRDYGLRADLDRAIWCRNMARGWAGKVAA